MRAPGASSSACRRLSMIRFFALFLVLLAVLFGLELTPPVQHWFVVPWTNTLARIIGSSHELL